MSLPNLFKLIKKYINSFLCLFKLSKRVDEIHENVNSLLYYLLMKEMYPEQIQLILPKLILQKFDVFDSFNVHIQKSSLKSIADKSSSFIVGLAENLIELPLSKKIELFDIACSLKCSSIHANYSKYIVFLARYGRSDEHLMNICNKFKSLGNNIFSKQCRIAWLYYISLLIREGMSDKAKKYLMIYLKYYNKHNLYEFPSVAYFANQVGISSKYIDKSSFLYSIYLVSNEDELTRYIKNKRVAIVGRSNEEIGLGRGEIIDSYDIVIRINHVPSTIYAKDFGTKTSIISYNLSNQHNFQTTKNVEYILIIDGIERHPFSINNIDKLLEIYRNGHNIFIPRLNSIYSALSYSEYTQFSTGVLTLLYFYSLNIKITSKDVFGFTHLLNQDCIRYGDLQKYHFDEDRYNEKHKSSLYHSHSIKRERDLLRKILL